MVEVLVYYMRGFLMAEMVVQLSRLQVREDHIIFNALEFFSQGSQYRSSKICVVNEYFNVVYKTAKVHQLKDQIENGPD